MTVKLPRTAWLLPAALTLALVGLLATSGVLWFGRSPTVADGAPDVAREAAITFFSLDYRHAEDDVAAMQDLATGDFARDYADQRDDFVATLERKKLVVTAEVPEDGVATEYAAADRAQVLVALDVTTTTTSGEEAQARYRTRVELRMVDGSWLVSGLEKVA